jgi:hypothetical protein
MTKFFIGFLLLSLLFISCKKESIIYNSESINEYFPLTIGKTITYQLDSTLFTNFGQGDTVVSYQAQDVVTEQTTDNLGRPAYLIVRYLRQDSTQNWTPNNTFMAIPTGNSIEYVENNLRFLKLEMPIRQGFSWNGNSYIDTYSVYSDLQYMANWDYTYDSLYTPLTINSVTIDSTIEVAERNEFLGEDPSNPATQYAEQTYSVEKYGKGIGLIYRDFVHWEYQGSQSIEPGYTGYGITLSMLNHN